MPLPIIPTKPADTVKTSVQHISDYHQDSASTETMPSNRQDLPLANSTEYLNKAKPQSTANLPEIPKIFVLDTNVLLHDPTSLFRFEEHDIFISMKTLEELDNNKQGVSDAARNARQVSRELDNLIADVNDNILLAEGIPLNKSGNIAATGRLYLQTIDRDTFPSLYKTKADNQILEAVAELTQKEKNKQVVLVSKDINMRLKARVLGLSAEDYFNDRVLEDSELLYSGILQLSDHFWQDHGDNLRTRAEKDHHGFNQTIYTLHGPVLPSLHLNQFVYLTQEQGNVFQARVTAANKTDASIKTIHNYLDEKNNVWGVTARNLEQNFALNLLMDPDIDFVTLVGQAGTGKTLLTLAAGLSQVFENQRYNEIIVTRSTIPIGEEIGFLPGTEEEKMTPWMGALDDNIEVLSSSDGSKGAWEQETARELVRSRISIKSMSFMRGRTFVKKFLIIDEAQNLTPKQMKTLITRAGPGTKIVCLGNLAQIDTPYLTEGSSGLTYAVDRFKNWRHSGHIILSRGERSRLADYASDNL